MEKQDYSEKFMLVKNEILTDIRNLLRPGDIHRFNEPFYVHYVDGEVATTEVCFAVAASLNRMVAFHTRREGSMDIEVISGGQVFKLEPNSLIDILDNLESDIQMERIARLRDAIKDAGGVITLADSFGIGGDERNFIEITKVRVSDAGALEVCGADSDEFTNVAKLISGEAFDWFLEYAEKSVRRKFTVRVEAVFSRVYDDIEAATLEEAIEKAKADLMEHPLDQEDSNGSEFDGYECTD